MRRLALAALIVATLTLSGCQTEPTSGGVNGTEHPRAGDYQSGSSLWIGAAGLALIAGGLVLWRRAER